MDERKQERKLLKKAYKRAKRKCVTAWKACSILFLVLVLIFTPLSIAVKLFDNGVSAFFNDTFCELVNADASASYFQSDFASVAELQAYKAQIGKQVMAEGAVLLMNENNALPLANNAQVRCLFDGELKTALEKVGLGVADTHGDAAIVMLSCENGEAERDLLQALSDKKQAGEVKKIIVLLSAEQAPQVDFLKGNPYGVDAVLWIGQLGIGGADAVAELLVGTLNPAGSLATTYGNAFQPADVRYDGAYRLYQAGIYVGYRYYETRYEDYVMGTGNAGSFVYSEQVAYPFGFGLSYTTFAYSDMAVAYNEETDKFAVTVTVTNSGTVAGKETVQVYAQAPYTAYDMENGVEKASVNLVGFGKTELLAPGESETVTVFVDKRELASYDAYGAKTYILDAGSYYLTVATDAHNAVNNILTAKGYFKEFTENRMDSDGNQTLTYKWEQVDFETYAATQNGTPITNRLSCAEPNLPQGVKWLSRQDWQGTLTMEPVALQPTDTVVADTAESAVSMPTMGAQNGLKLYDMIGLAFDDPKWQTLLDQLEFAEMATLVQDAFCWRMPVSSVQAPCVRDTHGIQLCDQPAEIEFVSCDVMMTAFHKELSYEVGKVMGNSCLAFDVMSLYDGVFVSNAEDGFLAGKLCSAVALGVRDKGVDVAFDGWCDRVGQAVWMQEQTARERYLRVAQYAFTEGRVNALQLAYIPWGASWENGQKGLLTVLREEWGNNGRVIADQILSDHVGAVEAVLAGVTVYGTGPIYTDALSAYKNDPTVVSALRQACHYNLYALANASAMNGMGAHTTVRLTEIKAVVLCRAVALVSVVLFAFFTVMWGVGRRKWKKTQAYLDYRTAKAAAKEEKAIAE